MWLVEIPSYRDHHHRAYRMNGDDDGLRGESTGPINTTGQAQVGTCSCWGFWALFFFFFVKMGWSRLKIGRGLDHVKYVWLIWNKDRQVLLATAILILTAWVRSAKLLIAWYSLKTTVMEFSKWQNHLGKRLKDCDTLDKRSWFFSASDNSKHKISLCYNA